MFKILRIVDAVDRGAHYFTHSFAATLRAQGTFECGAYFFSHCFAVLFGGYLE